MCTAAGRCRCPAQASEDQKAVRATICRSHSPTTCPAGPGRWHLVRSLLLIGPSVLLDRAHASLPVCELEAARGMTETLQLRDQRPRRRPRRRQRYPGCVRGGPAGTHRHRSGADRVLPGRDRPLQGPPGREVRRAGFLADGRNEDQQEGTAGPHRGVSARTSGWIRDAVSVCGPRAVAPEQAGLHGARRSGNGGPRSRRLRLVRASGRAHRLLISVR